MNAVGWVALCGCVVVMLLLCCAVRFGFAVFWVGFVDFGYFLVDFVECLVYHFGDRLCL